ncbi:MAG TPA: hypothetical protein VII59_19380, partial [Streptosporangiaceae bacterium]
MVADQAWGRAEAAGDAALVVAEALVADVTGVRTGPGRPGRGAHVFTTSPAARTTRRAAVGGRRQIGL